MDKNEERKCDCFLKNLEKVQEGMSGKGFYTDSARAIGYITLSDERTFQVQLKIQSDEEEWISDHDDMFNKKTDLK